MKIDFKLEGVDSTKALLRLYQKEVGKGIADGVKEMAQSSAKSLAMRVQPYGLSQSVGERFQKSVKRQVEFVAYAVRTGQAFGATTLEDGHNKMRRNGRLRIRKLPNAGRNIDIPQATVEQYVRKEVGKTGRAKAGWGDCMKNLGGKLSGFGNWVKRHVNGNYGTVSGVGTNVITMTNLTPYLTGPQKDKDVRYALAQGRKNGLKFIAKQVRGAINKRKKGL